LSDHVGEGCAFRHRRYPDVTCEFGDVFHLYRDHRASRSFHVGVRRLYVQNFSELIHHDGEGSFIPELVM
jgi:hypothetical protein